MSAVRGCDSCGDVFFESAEGWSTGTGTKFVKDSVTGQKKQVVIEQDLCPECTELRTSPAPRAHAAIGSRIAPTYEAEVVPE